MELSNVKLEVKVCGTCKGEGYVYEGSHDCWGKSETYSHSCWTCGGYGFILHKDVVKEIKQSLGLY